MPESPRCMERLNKFRKADLVRLNIVREVHVLEEHISETVEVLATLVLGKENKRLTAIEWR